MGTDRFISVIEDHTCSGQPLESVYLQHVCACDGTQCVVVVWV